MSYRNILIDAREFVEGRISGIGRVLKGLILSISDSNLADSIRVAVRSKADIPFLINENGNIKGIEIPSSFMGSEKMLSGLTRSDINLFISPYPKLPLFGCHCRSIHIIHDVLDLTYFFYQNRIRKYFDRFRLKKALKLSDMTWYDSRVSLLETQKLIGLKGSNPRIRYPGIGDNFIPEYSLEDKAVLNRYGLGKGYILVLGNGLPHKNLGILLAISKDIKRSLVFIGTPNDRQPWWMRRYPEANVRWFANISDTDLPAIIRSAFLLAQPSLAEGYGYPPLEAMACGVPAVVSNIPVLKETTGGICLTADPKEPSEWLEAFHALEDNFLYREMVGKGIDWIEPLKGQKAWKPYISDIEELLH